MKKQNKDKRIKTSLFPFSIFIFTSIGFALFTTGQMKIIGEYIDITKIPFVDAIAIPAMWVIAAAAFTFITAYQIDKRYQKPLEDFAQATKKVASGDFSVYMAPSTRRIRQTIWMLFSQISIRWWKSWEVSKH